MFSEMTTLLNLVEVQLSNQLNLMYETDSVYTLQILTDNFLLALDSCAPFEVKLIKIPPGRWMTETIKMKSIRNIS